MIQHSSLAALVSVKIVLTARPVVTGRLGYERAGECAIVAFAVGHTRTDCRFTCTRSVKSKKKEQGERLQTEQIDSNLDVDGRLKDHCEECEIIYESRCCHCGGSKKTLGALGQGEESTYSAQGAWQLSGD